MSRFKLMFLCIFILCSVHIEASINAQTLTDDNDAILYKKTTESLTTFVRLSNASRTEVSSPTNLCPEMSRQGSYVATQVDDDIVIQRSDDLTIIAQVPRQEGAIDCLHAWRTDSLLTIRGREREGYENRYVYLLRDGVLIGDLLPSMRTLPPLPGYLRDTINHFALSSPDGSYVFYERCESEKVVGGEGTDFPLQCAEETEFVVYNPDQQEDIVTLDDALDEIVRGEIARYRTNRRSYNGAAWSSTGQYLAYVTASTSLAARYALSVYDVHNGRNLNTSFPGFNLDVWKDISWSPTEPKVLFWVVGVFTSDETEYDPMLSNPIIYDTETEQFIDVDNAFDLNGRSGTIGRFSPSGAGYSFVDANGDLIYIDIDTGSSSVLDTNVDRIIGWQTDTSRASGDCSFTLFSDDNIGLNAWLSSAVASGEPETICLAENGIYELTTPLPVISSAIFVAGNNASVSITAGYNDRFFDISATGSLTLENITLTGGNAGMENGGAIRNAGSLTLRNVTLTDNSAANGGAIYNTGTLVIEGGELRGNTASAQGGAIWTTGDYTITDSLLIENSATEGSAIYEME